ncbi:hypothetical protein HAX54_011951, partial [Datura stramonium]|nr:hypothetical protein [Datura stramonium]
GLDQQVLDEGKASCGMTRLGDSMVRGKARCGMTRLGEMLDKGKVMARSSARRGQGKLGMTWPSDGTAKGKASCGMTRPGEGKASLWKMHGTGDDSRGKRACALARASACAWTWALACAQTWALACARTRQTRRETRSRQAHARDRCGAKCGTDPEISGMWLVVHCGLEHGRTWPSSIAHGRAAAAYK